MFESLMAQMNRTIQHAVAACTDGVAPWDVKKIKMVLSSSKSNAKLLRGAPSSYADDQTTVVQYEVTSHDPAVDFDTLKAQIQEASSSGVLAEHISYYAGVFDAPTLTNVTVSAPHITSESTSSDENARRDLSPGEIAGIVIGVVFFVLLCVLITGLAVYSRASGKVGTHPHTSVATSDPASTGGA
jgi:hypothetical protein